MHITWVQSCKIWETALVFHSDEWSMLTSDGETESLQKPDSEPTVLNLIMLSSYIDTWTFVKFYTVDNYDWKYQLRNVDFD